MPRARLPKSDVLLAYANAAFANGEALARDARTLAGCELWPRATALMILACEELGKAKYAHLLGVGVLKEKLGSPSSMDVLKSRHVYKQMIALDVDMPYLRELLELAFSGLHIPDAVDLDSPAAQHALQDLLGEVTRRVDQMPVDRTRLEEDIHRVRRDWDGVVIERRWDKLKQQALYVDISSDQRAVATPKRVGPEEFSSAAALFERAQGSIDIAALRRLTADFMQRVRPVAIEDAPPEDTPDIR